MLAIKVTFDERSLKEAAHILRAIPRAMPRVMRRAIKQAVSKTAMDFKERVVQQVNIKKGEVGKRLKKKWSSEEGSIAAAYHRVGLMAFKGTSPTKRGVTYRIEKGGSRKRIEHGFIATLESGHRGVFLRARYSKATGYTYQPMKGKSKKEAIYESRGPSVWKVIVGTPGLLKAATDTASKKMVKYIDNQISEEFRRWKR